jgi:hypothetical protein
MEHSHNFKMRRGSKDGNTVNYGVGLAAGLTGYLAVAAVIA